MLSNDPELIVLFNNVNKKYFNNELTLNGIYWASTQALYLKQKSRLRLLGLCNLTRALIFINERLKNPKIPQLIREYILVHECAHLSSKRVYHCKKFRKEMQRYPRVRQAETWLKKNEDQYYKG